MNYTVVQRSRIPLSVQELDSAQLAHALGGEGGIVHMVGWTQTVYQGVSDGDDYVRPGQ